jgi:hypothetical protein
VRGQLKAPRLPKLNFCKLKMIAAVDEGKQPQQLGFRQGPDDTRSEQPGGTSPGQLLGPSSQGPAWLSGGSVGPEGSVLVLAVLAVMFVVFHFAFPAQNADQLLANKNV